MEQFKKDCKVAGFIIVCILINFLGKQLSLICSLPLWLDNMGTVISAYALGPVIGAIVGFTGNIINGMSDPNINIYATVSVAVGLLVGIYARKKMFENLFKTSIVAMLLTIVSVVISSIFNCILYDGNTGNIWSDGILAMLVEWKVPWYMASVIGVFFIEFVDKLFILIFLFLLIHGKRYFLKKKSKKVTACIFLCILFLSESFNMTAFAADESKVEENKDYNSYIQTIYSNNNGLLSGEANDVVCTNDGALWIATYAGLYRYNGSDFQYMNSFDTIKNANDLYIDEEGRLWIGTNDDGLSLYINNEITNTLNSDSGLPSNSVRSIVRHADGNYYVGTSESLAIVTISGGLKIIKIIPKIQYASDLAADASGHIAAVTSSGDLFLMQGEKITDQINSLDGNVYHTSCFFDHTGNLYVGTDQSEVKVYSVVDDMLKLDHVISLKNMSAINRIYETDNQELFFCTENGIAYKKENSEIHYISSGSFNSSIDNMTVDYQGNLWFCSSRLGIMKMCPSAFSELYPEVGLSENVVNTVTQWHGKIYCGTDTGLDLIHKDSGKVLTNALTQKLKEMRIRDIMSDSSGNLWICTYGGGIVKVDSQERIHEIALPENLRGGKFRCAIELSDGSLVVASDLGMVYLKDDKVVKVLSSEDGLGNSVVLCMLQREDGTILAGTDGGGISVIKQKKVIHTIKRSEKLDSDVILRIVQDKGGEGVFLVTSNGLCYMKDEDNIQKLNNFPYSNNFDIYDDGEGKLFVTGSAGIYVTSKENLLSGSTTGFQLLDYLSGLRGSLTANAWNYVDKDNVWYIANGTGVTKLDLKDYSTSIESYRMHMKSIVIDGKEHMVKRGNVINLSRNSYTLEINPEIINYMPDDPYVRYYLEGFDEEPVTVHQSELSTITYTNLKTGTYRFHFAILDGDQKNKIEERVYTIIKEKKIYDNWWFKLFFFVELVLIVAWFTWFITRTLLQRTLDFQQKEIALAKEHIRMGNETIIAIAKTVDAKDENTSQHSFRVSEYSVMIARRLGYSEDECENLRKAALLHDIGKIGIPDGILNKPSRLTDEEYKIMKSHVVLGSDILKDFTLIPHVQDGALYHHERYDGKGYAHGLKGEEIPEWARIIGIADAFDAMTANRVYRKKLDFDFVIEEIKRCSGTQFDPKMAEVLLSLIEEGQIDIDKLYEEESSYET